MKNPLTPKTIAILILVISLSANIYWFGTQWIQKERQAYFNAGAAVVRNSVVKQIIETGQVIVEDEKGQRVMLTPLIQE